MADNKNSKGFNWGGALGNLAGGVIGMIGQNARAKKQHERQKELMGIQAKNQNRLNAQGAALQMDMWNKTNYGAQVKHLNDAGLNPSLLYGMSGGGGVTTGSQTGGSAAGGNAAAPMDIGNAIQAGMMTSQIELNKSQANKNDAEAADIRGEEGTKGESEINLIKSNVEKNASEILVNKSKDEVNKSVVSLNKALENLNNQKINESINAVNLSEKDIKWQEENGLSPNDSQLAKTIKYLAKNTGMSEKTIISLAGGLAALKGITGVVGTLKR